jgi:hypothetical protein
MLSVVRCLTKRLQPRGRGAASSTPELNEPRPAAEAHVVMQAGPRSGRVAVWGGHSPGREQPHGAGIVERLLASPRARAVSVSAPFARGVVRLLLAPVRRTPLAASDRSGVHGPRRDSHRRFAPIAGSLSVERGGRLRASRLGRWSASSGLITTRLQPTGRGAARSTPKHPGPRPAAEAHVVSQRNPLRVACP